VAIEEDVEAVGVADIRPELVEVVEVGVRLEVLQELAVPEHHGILDR